MWEMDADDRKIFMNLKAGTADKNQISQSLYTLMRLMREYYQKPVILLLDEYDVPIAKASNNGYYREMLDVMNFMRDVQNKPDAVPASYWKNTSDNAIIRSFIDYAGNSITKKLETLLSGGHIVQKIDENLTYDYLHSSEDNLWSILYLTGYLTKVRETDLTAPITEGMIALVIPNAEIKEIFESTITKWFDDNAKAWNRTELFHAVWQGDSEKLAQEMTKLLRKTISYHDYKEDFYHAFLAGIFAGAGYPVESNREHGEGRSDIIVYDIVNARVAVFEAKISESLDQMENVCQRAVEQIDDRMYAKEFEDDYDQVLCYGVSFYKKRCLVKKK